MALLRSPDGSWTGEVLLPVDVVNLKTRGYTVVEPNLVDVESDVMPTPVVGSVTVSLDETVTAGDKPTGK